MLLSCDEHADCIVVYFAASRQCPVCLEQSEKGDDLDEIEDRTLSMAQEITHIEKELEAWKELYYDLKKNAGTKG